MFPAKFDYVRAESLDQVIALLGEHDEAKILSGGHSLIPMLKLRLAQPALLVDIGRIAELRGISRDGDTVRIGAAATHHEIATSETVAQAAPLLAAAAAKVGDPQVRNKGTLGGNIAHADPASDLPAPLVALGATVNVRGADGQRSIPAADFFVDLLTTALGEGEILTSIEFPALASGDGSAYEKFENPASGYAVCAAAAVIRGGAISLVYNGVSPTPLSADAVCSALGGQLDEATITGALDQHLTIENPMTDLHASAGYRLQLAKVYGKRALSAARDARG